MTAPSPDAVLHLAALHTLAATGFASTSRAASLTLSVTLARYLRLVATTCAERAALAGRHKVAAIDVVQALEELGVGGIGELHEWTAGLGKEVCLTAPGLEALGEGLRQGLGVDEAVAEMRLVEGKEKDESDESDEGDESDEDDVKMDIEPIRFASPDLSWLPSTTTNAPYQDEITPSTILTPATSIADRYRRRIPWEQSQLSARPFVDPPKPTINLPPGTSSFAKLSTAFAATAGAPSVAMRQTPLRQQLTEILRLHVAPSDAYIPSDTLISPIAPPRTTPIVPSHSDTIPPRFIPLDPDPKSMLASLVHQIHSPQLPPALRERLTSVRPPVAQMRDGKPILYGEPVRGPSEAALAKARGKTAEAEHADQGWLRATWDSGPKGSEKCGRGRLPTGRKVVQSGQGEEKPRVPEGTARAAPKMFKLRVPGSTENPLSPAAASAPVGAPTGGIRLKLVKRESVDGPATSEQPDRSVSPPKPVANSETPESKPISTAQDNDADSTIMENESAAETAEPRQVDTA